MSTYILFLLGKFGINAGAHRLWSHNAYKANFLLRVILMFFSTLANQNSIWKWAKDHRAHHKYMETKTDSCNSVYGFFFSHVKLLIFKENKDTDNIEKHIDLQDLETDNVVIFQKKYYVILVLLVSFILPSIIPVYFWNESWINAILITIFLRYTIGLYETFFINLVTHNDYGRPYDKQINSSKNYIESLGILGGECNNFHYTFPSDYKTSEYYHYMSNWTTGFIKLLEKIGWIYDVNCVSEQTIKKRCLKTGDGSHEIWGWCDIQQSQEEPEEAIFNTFYT
ncbi:hypothetical protein HCN44_005072 [Aphidius gifuensis]|uniref:Desaturase n=1 Tax=Aphidius gifuensis TaxID=684658 RepID=A0A834XSN3_APHGI|nr:hypothetical protein HCN44_005072 [Aphidius gifuensis]